MGTDSRARAGLAVAALLLVAGTLAPGTADAATVYLSGTGNSKVLHFDAAAGEENWAQFTDAVSAGTSYLFVNDVEPLQAGAGCSQITANWSQCPDSGVSSAVFNLGDGNDSFASTAGAVVAFPVQIYGGAGDDYLSSWSSGQDTVDAGPGNDQVFPYTVGADDLRGGDGRDVFYTGGGLGDSFATSLDDVANDGAAGQHMNVHSDFEEIQGGLGDDTITGTAGPDTLEGGFGSDVIHGAGGDDTVSGGPDSCGDSDAVYGDGGDDSVENQTSGTLDGGPGNDTLLPALGCGGMTVAGGDGTDTADLHETGWPAVVSLDGSANDYAEVGGQVPANNFATDIERLIGTSNDDVLTGSSHDDYIDGAGGDDVIDGAAGADDLHGGSGSDIVDYSSRTKPVVVDIGGEAGDGEAGEGDTVAGDFEGIWGGSGADTLTGGAGEDEIDGGAGADRMAGGPGYDAIDYSLRTNRVQADADGQVGDDGETGEGDTIATDVEDLIGGAGPDELTVNATAAYSYLLGGPGDDHLIGQSPAYGVLIGEDGNDSLVGGAGPDEFDAGRGDDTINSDDGVAEAPVCGDGLDSVQRDAYDSPAPDCEILSLLPPLPQPTQPGPGGPPLPRPPLATGIAPGGRLTLKPGGLRHLLIRGQLVRVHCANACDATIVATIGAKTAHRLGLRAHRPLQIARAIQRGGGRSAFNIVVEPWRRLRAKLGRARRLTVTLHLVTSNSERLTSSDDVVVHFRR